MHYEFKPNTYYSAPAYEMKMNLMLGLRKYEDYTMSELNLIAELICDPNCDEIPDVLGKDALLHHRKRYSEINMDKKSKATSGPTNSRIVDRAIVISQIKRLNEQVKQNGKIDLNTPIFDFYLTSRAYRAVHGSLYFWFGENLTLKHLVFYGHVLSKSRIIDDKLVGIGVATRNEIMDIIVACGYGDISSIDDFDLTFRDIDEALKDNKVIDYSRDSIDLRREIELLKDESKRKKGKKDIDDSTGKSTNASVIIKQLM